MLYNHEEFPRYMRTAGKITVLTTLTGILVFLVALTLDLGNKELNKASAQTQGYATTSLQVLNTPPEFQINAFENPASATTSPTNSGDDVTWNAVATDANGAPYFLLICQTNASPTPQSATPGNLGTAPPSCNGGQWAVSPAANSGSTSIAATTTTESAPFAESNDWYAWVCDDDPISPRCNSVAVQGPTSTPAGSSSSPFNVNRRPVLDNAYNDGPVDPGAVIGFFSTSSDPDVVGGADNLFITVCNTDTNYDSGTDTCSDFIASSTIGVTDNASTTRLITIPTRDQTYPAFIYVYDEHGHEALANPIQANFDVNNVAPIISGGDIILDGGTNMILTIPGGETPGFTLDFTVRDNNSCLTAASTSEIVSYDVALFRSNLHSTSTCDASAAAYDPNNCYTSGVGTTTWNLSCTATTTCASPLQDDIDYACTFPLWFLADPTDEAAPNIPTAFGDDVWTVAVAGVDNDNASGTLATTTNAVELESFNALDILASNIAYAPTEAGDDTGSTNATSTALNIGNTGLDQEVRGSDMCGTYSPTSTCPVDPDGTIPADRQLFSSTTFNYGVDFALSLATSSDTEVELDVPKTTSTVQANYQRGTTYWGIGVPASITIAGAYTGLNTFTSRTAEPGDW